MKLKKSPFFHFVVLLAIILFTYSCGKKKQENVVVQKDLSAINKLLDIGHQFFSDEKLDSSYYYFAKARSLAESKKDTSRIIHSIAWLAEIQRFLCDYSNSEATAVEAFPYIENTTKFPNGKFNIYNTLANDYLYTYDNKNAIRYFEKAFHLEVDSIEKCNMKNNIAFVYIQQKKYDSAIKILSELSLNPAILKDPEAKSRVFDNLGYSYSKVGNSKALPLLQESVKIRKKHNKDRSLIGSYFHLYEHYKKSNLNLALAYANLTYQLATKVNSVDERLESLAILIEYSQPTQSKDYSKLYLHLNDSITKVRLKAKNQFAKIKYDSKKEKDENLKLKAQKVLQEEQQRKRNLYLYFGVGIIILTSILISNFLIAKNKREKIKASYTTEIRIAKKLHDELANDVYQTMAFAETQDLSINTNKERLLNNLDTIYSRTRNISKENNIIDSGPLFLSSLKEMMSGFNKDEVNILTNGIDTINWKDLEENKKITIYRVLQELLVNMKKHSQCSLVIISFKINDGKFQIDYSDNGIGATSEKLTSKNGLHNVENRIKSIKGTISFDTKSNKGFKVSFMFPI